MFYYPIIEAFCLSILTRGHEKTFEGAQIAFLGRYIGGGNRSHLTPPATTPLRKYGSSSQGIVANRAEQELKAHFVITSPDYKMIRSAENPLSKKQRDGIKRNVFQTRYDRVGIGTSKLLY